MGKPSSVRNLAANWSSYSMSLRNLRLLLIWFDKDASWNAFYDRSSGRPAVF